MPRPFSNAIQEPHVDVPFHQTWLAVLLAFLLLSAAPLVEAQSKPQPPGALKDAEKAITDAEALAGTGPSTGKDFADFHKREEKRKGLLPRLRKADVELTKYLEKNSADAAALFLRVRLDMVSRLITPIEISGGQVQKQDVPSPDRDPQRTLDRILEIDPSNAEACFLKARLYAAGTMTLEGPKRELAKAAQYARMAVERAPANEKYRRSLIFLLASSGDRAGAKEAAAALGDHESPFNRLLADSLAMPAPEGGVEDSERASGWAEVLLPMLLPSPDLPALRTQYYRLFKSTEEIEAFYARHWEGMKLFYFTAGDIREVVVSVLGGVPQEGNQQIFVGSAFFDWEGEKLAWVPIDAIQNRLQKRGPWAGLALLVIEIVNPRDHLRESLHVPEGSNVVSQVLVMNLRLVKSPKL